MTSYRASWENRQNQMCDALAGLTRNGTMRDERWAWTRLRARRQCSPFSKRRKAGRRRTLQMASGPAGDAPRDPSTTLPDHRHVPSRVRSIFARRRATVRGESAASRLAVPRVGDYTAKWIRGDWGDPTGGRKRCQPWDGVSGRRRQQAECYDGRHRASILGLTFETLKALISGHPALVPKLTLCETRGGPA